jgi:WD40 repeat protein
LNNEEDEQDEKRQRTDSSQSTKFLHSTPSPPPLELDMDLSTTSDGRHIVSSDLSSNGNYVCVAFTTRVTLYSLNEIFSKKMKKLNEKPKLVVTPCRMPESSDDEVVEEALKVFRRGSHYVQFFQDSSIVAIAQKKKMKTGQLIPVIHILQLPSKGITKEGQSSTLVVPPRLLMTLVSNYTDDATPYDSIVISPDQKFVAGGTIGGDVRIWCVDNVDQNGSTIVCQSLPNLEGVHHTSLSFSPTGESLVLLCDDNTFHVWDVDFKKVR